MHGVFRIALVGLILSVMIAPAGAQTIPSKTLTGENTGDKLGVSLSAVPDVTGDGRPEFVVGVFRADKPGNPTSIVDAGAAYLYNGATCKRLRVFYGEKTDARMGYAVAGVPDLDGDGKGDLLLGSPRYWGVGSWSGRVYVISGASGKLIRTLDGGAETAQFGYAVAGLEDVTGDGKGEILVGAWGQNGTAGADAGRAFLYSGADGKLLKEWQGEGKDHYLGVSVAGVPDADGDGKMDILLGAYGYGVSPEENRGRVYLYSGASGNLIRTHTGENAGDTFGWSVAGVQDTNGDGRGDLLVGARDFDPPNLHNAGRVYLYSGTDGALLNTFDAQKSMDNLGRNVAGVPDMDSDGRGDLLLPAHRGDGKAGVDSGIVYVRSGATGKLLFTFEGEAAGDYLGWGVAGIDDVNGDGRGDLLLGAYPHSEPGKTEAGRAYVYTQGLTADTAYLSARLGGLVNLYLDAGKANRSRIYQVVCSLWGAEPGVTFPGVHLPVAFDDLFIASFLLSNTSLFNHTRGYLDGEGKAHAWIRVPAGVLQGLENRTLTFGYALLDGLNMAANPVKVMILP